MGQGDLPVGGASDPIEMLQPGLIHKVGSATPNPPYRSCTGICVMNCGSSKRRGEEDGWINIVVYFKYYLLCWCHLQLSELCARARKRERETLTGRHQPPQSVWPPTVRGEKVLLCEWRERRRTESKTLTEFSLSVFTANRELSTVQRATPGSTRGAQKR